MTRISNLSITHGGYPLAIFFVCCPHPDCIAKLNTIIPPWPAFAHEDKYLLTVRYAPPIIFHFRVMKYPAFIHIDCSFSCIIICMYIFPSSLFPKQTHIYFFKLKYGLGRLNFHTDGKNFCAYTRESERSAAGRICRVSLYDAP